MAVQPMIPAEAVDAAARYVWEKSNAPIPWGHATKRARELYLDDARLALEGYEAWRQAVAKNEATNE